MPCIKNTENNTGNLSHSFAQNWVCMTDDIASIY